jgi:hypothetical protein
MAQSGLLLDYAGIIDHKKINNLLNTLKSSKEFLSLDKTTRKRLYAILVECLENISRHSLKDSAFDKNFRPFISAWGDNKDMIIIKTGNPVYQHQIVILEKELTRVNQMKDRDLTALYDEIINRERKQNDKGAGLGFIVMKSKSGNNIDYSFTAIDTNYSFFEMKILLNIYIMRKLILKKTESSPAVILDPDKNIFEISGESRPPDVSAFYGEILKWMDDFSIHLIKLQNNSDPIVFNFDLEYFNSWSAKYILDLCKQMASLRSKGKNIEVKWKYEEDDIDLLEAGKEMSRLSKLPFEYVMSENR